MALEQSIREIVHYRDVQYYSTLNISLDAKFSSFLLVNFIAKYTGNGSHKNKP